MTDVIVRPNGLHVRVDGKWLSGWALAQMKVGVEVFPNECTVVTTINRTKRQITGRLPSFNGKAVEIYLDGQKVMTGKGTRTYSELDTKSQVEIISRGNCQDLVECSAEWPGGQISGANVLEIARKLASAYNIEVVTNETDLGPVIPQINMSFGETPYGILERLCRYAGLLLYENEHGQLVLARVGTEKATGGLVEGENMQVARILHASDQRYSDVSVALTSTDVFSDTGSGSNFLATVKDPNVGRNRKLFLIAEAGSGGLDISQRRAQWEVSRRAGRSLQVTVKADSWKDTAGKIWRPNSIVPVTIPSLHLAKTEMVISAISFMQEARAGTWAELLLMPKEAYSIEPILLQPIAADVVPGVPGG